MAGHAIGVTAPPGPVTSAHEVETTRSIALSAIITGCLAVSITLFGFFVFVSASFTDAFVVPSRSRFGYGVKDMSTQGTLTGMVALAVGIALIGATTNALTRRHKGSVPRARPVVPRRSHVLTVASAASVGYYFAFAGVLVFFSAAFTDTFVEESGFSYREDHSDRFLMIGMALMIVGGLILLMTVWAIRGRTPGAPNRISELVPPGPFTWSGLTAAAISILFTVAGLFVTAAHAMSERDDPMFDDGGDVERLMVFFLLLGIFGIIAATEALRGRMWARWSTVGVLIAGAVFLLHEFSSAEAPGFMMFLTFAIFGLVIAGQLTPRSSTHYQTAEAHHAHH